jgi:UBX domain/UBA-like domain
MNSLPDSQKEAVANYQAITETWNSERALEMLQKYDWDVTRASNEYFSLNTAENYINSDSDSEADLNTYQPRLLNLRPINLYNNLRNPKVPDYKKDSKNGNDLKADDIEPANTYSGRSRICSLFHCIWNSIIPEKIRGENSKAATGFSKRIKDVCKTPLNFSKLKFQKLLNYAFQRSKPLFVYLHAYSEDYPIEIFSDNQLISLLNKEFIYWGVDSSSEEGIMLKNKLNIEIFPCSLIIKVENPKTPRVLEINPGYLDVKNIYRVLEEHTNSANRKLIQERRLREQQEEEFKEAEKELVNREKKNREKFEEDLKETQRIAKEKEEKKKLLVKKVGFEPVESENTAQVSFKLPSGKRIERKFNREQSIDSLYEFLESIDLHPSELVTGYPSKTLQNRESTLETEGIYPKSVIHVRESAD